MAYLDALTRQGLRASVQTGGKLRLEPDWLITDDVRQFVHKHRDKLVGEITKNVNPDGSSEEIVPDYHILWVATDLDSFEEHDPRFGYELNCEPVYRMLDATYYAWLRHRMENARKAYESGRLDDSTVESLKTRFNTIHEWAVRHIGEDVLRRAVRTTNVKSYIPPSEQTFAAYRKTWDDAWNAYRRREAQCISAQSDQARKLNHALATRGYAGIRSSIIPDIVVFVRDDSVVVPDKWADKVRFTMDELKLMIGSSPEAVQQIYEVKRIFGGKVVPNDDHPSGTGARMTGPVSMVPVQQSLFSAG